MSDEGEEYYDAFISYAWGQNDRHQARVALLRAELVTEHKRKIFQDTEELEPESLDLQVGSAIENSHLIIFILTRDYETRVVRRQSGSSNCRYEFNVATLKKGPKFFSTVVQDQGIVDRWPQKIEARILGHLGEIVWLDMTKDENVKKVAKSINKKIDKLKKEMGKSTTGRPMAQVDESKSRLSLNKKRSDFVEGTRRWVLQHVFIWHRSPDSAFKKPFILSAESGMGKSVLVAELAARGGLFDSHRAIPNATIRSSNTHSSGVRDAAQRASQRLSQRLSRSARNDEEVKVYAAHSFDATPEVQQTDVKSARVAILSLAKQLVNAYPGMAETLPDAERNNGYGERGLSSIPVGDLFNDYLVQPLRNVRSERSVVVLDGLSQDVNGYDGLVDVIRWRWSSEMPSWLGLVVSCDPTVGEQLASDRETHVRIQPMEQNNIQDIGKLAEDGLKNVFRDEARLRSVTETIVDESRGNMKEARRSINRMSQGASISGGLLGAGSVSLEEAIELFLQGSGRGRGSSGDRRRKLLLALCVTREPLPVSAVEHILELADLQEVRAIIAEAPQLFQAISGDNVSLRDQDLRQILEDRYSAELRRGHEILARFCISRLSGFPFCAKHVVYHLVEAGFVGDLSNLLVNYGNLHDAFFEQGAPIRGWLTDLVQIGDWAQLRAGAREVAEMLRDHVLALEQDSRQLIRFARDLSADHPLHNSAALFQVPYPQVQLTAGSSVLRDRVLDTFPSYEVSSVALNSGRALVSGKSYSGSSVIRAIDLATGKEIFSKTLPDVFVTKVTLSGAGAACLTEDNNASVQAWILSSETGEMEPFGDSRERVNCLAMSEDHLVTGLDNGNCKIWNINDTRRVVETLRPSSSGRSIQDVDIDPEYVVCATRQCKIWIFSRPNFSLTREISFRNSVTDNCMCVAVGDGLLVSGGSKGNICVWSSLDDAGHDEPLTIFQGTREKVTSIATRNKVVASGSVDRTVRVWSFQPGAPQGAAPMHEFNDHNQHVGAVALNASGSSVLCGFEDGALHLKNCSDQAPSSGNGESTSSPATCAMFLGERLLVSGHESGEVRVWDAEDGALKRVLESEHRHSVKSIATDDKYIATAALHEICLWSAQPPHDLMERIPREDIVLEHICLESARRAGDDSFLVVWDQNSRPSGYHLSGATVTPSQRLKRRSEVAPPSHSVVQSFRWKVVGRHVDRDLACGFTMESAVSVSIPTEDNLYAFTESNGELRILTIKEPEAQE